MLWYISSAKKVVAVRRGLVGLHQCYNLSRKNIIIDIIMMLIIIQCYNLSRTNVFIIVVVVMIIIIRWWLSFWWWWWSYRLHQCYNLSRTIFYHCCCCDDYYYYHFDDDHHFDDDADHIDCTSAITWAKPMFVLSLLSLWWWLSLLSF